MLKCVIFLLLRLWTAQVGGQAQAVLRGVCGETIAGRIRTKADGRDGYASSIHGPAQRFLQIE